MGAFDTVKFKSLVKLMLANGFIQKSQSGSHITFKKPGLDEIITLAKHGKEVPTYSAKDVMRALGLTPKEFLREIKKY